MPAGLPVTQIAPARGWSALNLRELWARREMVYLLVRRDYTVRYRHTAVGISWVLIQPLLSMLMLTLFARIAGIGTDRIPGKIPYPLFAAAGLAPWTFFTHALTQSSNCLVHGHSLLTRVWFPRIVLPLAAVAGSCVDLVVVCLLLPILLVFFRMPPSIHLLALPLLFVLAAFIALAAGLWLAVLNLEFRDLGNVLPFVFQLLFFATPVAYPVSMIPKPWQSYAGLNPVAGLVEGFRWALLGSSPENLPQTLGWSAAVSVLLFAGGLVLFQSREEKMADIV